MGRSSSQVFVRVEVRIKARAEKESTTFGRIKWGVNGMKLSGPFRPKVILLSCTD